MPYLKIAVHRRRHEIVGLLETTSRNVSNEKKNSLQLNKVMCRTRWRLLQIWKAHILED